MYYVKINASDTVERPKRNRRPPIKHTSYFTVMTSNRRQIKKARSTISKHVNISLLPMKHNGKVEPKNSLRSSRRIADIKPISHNARGRGRVEESNVKSDTEKPLPGARKQPTNSAQKDKENEFFFPPSKTSVNANSLQESRATHSNRTSLSRTRKPAVKSKSYTGFTEGGARTVDKKFESVPSKRSISLQLSSSDDGKMSSPLAKRPRRGNYSEENGRIVVGSKCVCGKRRREVGKSECDVCIMDRRNRLTYPKVSLRACRVHLSECSSHPGERQAKHTRRETTTKPVKIKVCDLGQRLDKIGKYSLRKPQVMVPKRNESRKSKMNEKVLNVPSSRGKGLVSLRGRNKKLEKGETGRKISHKQKTLNSKKVYSCSICKLCCSGNIEKMLHEFGHVNKKVLTIVLKRYIPRNLGIAESNVDSSNIRDKSMECDEVKHATEPVIEATNTQSVEVTSTSNKTDSRTGSDNSQQVISDKCDVGTNPESERKHSFKDRILDETEMNTLSAIVREENVINEAKSNEVKHRLDEKDDNCVAVLNGNDSSSEETVNSSDVAVTNTEKSTDKHTPKALDVNSSDVTVTNTEESTDNLPPMAVEVISPDVTVTNTEESTDKHTLLAMDVISSGVTVTNTEKSTGEHKEVDVEDKMEKLFPIGQRTSGEEMTTGSSEGETEHIDSTPKNEISSSPNTYVSMKEGVNERQESNDSADLVRGEDACKSSSREDSPGTLCIDETVDEAREEPQALASSISYTADEDKAATPNSNLVNGDSHETESSEVHASYSDNSHNDSKACEGHKNHVSDSVVPSVIAEDCNLTECSLPSDNHNTVLGSDNQSTFQDYISDTTYTADSVHESLPDASLHSTCSDESPTASECVGRHTQAEEQGPDTAGDVLQGGTAGTDHPECAESDVACPEQEEHLTCSDMLDNKLADCGGTARKTLEQDLSDISSDGFEIDDDDTQETGDTVPVTEARLSASCEQQAACPSMDGCSRSKSGTPSPMSVKEGKLPEDNLCKQHFQLETIPRRSPQEAEATVNKASELLSTNGH